MKKYIYKQKSLRGDEVYFMDKKAREDIEDFKETVEEEIGEIDSTLDGHIKNKQNPHNVTLAQVLGGGVGVVPIVNGGTGANTVAAARNNFGLGNTNGPVPVANGGTGATNGIDALVNLGVTSITIERINAICV